VKKLPHSARRARSTADDDDTPEPHGDHGPARRRRPPPDERHLEAAAEIFRAAGDLSRLRILEHLAEERCCVTELAAMSGASLSAVSQQLRVLRAAGLVRRAREGKHIYYALADEHVTDLLRCALAHAGESD
jgi:ArsR family transcriptional regulator, lead/cadmium/zinc/bismuth-responsive transcriptional repressor